MKITQIGHAATLVQARGTSILSDPWWKGPCFGAQWWVYPKPFLAGLDGVELDYIYISHGHHDHLHGGTLKTLPKTAKVLICAELGLAQTIRDLGFEPVEVPSDREVELGSSGVRCRIIQTHGDDSLLAIDDGERVCININDALHSAPHDVQDFHVAQLKRFYPRIDYALCGYGVASHFPNCYVIPDKDPAATAIRRQQYFNREWVRLMRALEPRHAFPFAADVVLLEDALFWANVPVHNGERPVEALRIEWPDCSIQAYDIAPGFVIEDDVVLNPALRVPVEESAIRAELADGIRRSNTVAATSREAVEEVAAMLRARVGQWQSALATFQVDYRILVRFHNSATHLALVKADGRVALETVDGVVDEDAYDLVYRTRLAYLKWALVEQRGDEILFVGSGGIFEYRSRDLVAFNAHRELIDLFRNHVRTRETPTPARSVVEAARRVAASLLGRNRVDLYDVDQWTVYRAADAATTRTGTEP